MFPKVLFLLIWVFIAQLYSKSADDRQAVLHISLGKSVDKPDKLVIERHGLADYIVASDTSKIGNTDFIYSIPLEEPELISVVMLWASGKRRSTSFRAFPSTYDLTVNEQQKLMLTNLNNLSESEIEFNNLQKLLDISSQHTDSLTSLVNYENRPITEVEEQISAIRDSMENVIDEEVYKKYAISHLNSPSGLFALAKYAERPLDKQRRKWQPDYIEKLLNQFSRPIQALPTFKVLKAKISLARQLTVGNTGKDLTVIDTAGIALDTRNFRGKYLLIDFWASWCGPCRDENPGLIKAFNTYKHRGVNILSITLDNRNQSKPWKKAIKEDQIGAWYHASDYDNLAQHAYDVQVVPSNFLLDPQGKIIAVNLRANELNAKLEQIFKN